MKRRMIGILLLIGAIAIVIYISGWLCFLEPIFDIIAYVKVGVTVKDVVLVLCKFFFFLPMSCFCALILGVAGDAMLFDK